MDLNIDKLDNLLDTLAGMAKEAVRLFGEIRGHKAPVAIGDLLIEDPPPLDGEFDPRVAGLYELLWEHRQDALARFYEPERVYISRALYKLVLDLPADDLVPPSSLIEAAKVIFFLMIRDKWHRVRVEEVPTGLQTFETVVKSTDVLITAILHEMRKHGLLDGVEVAAVN